MLTGPKDLIPLLNGCKGKQQRTSTSVANDMHSVVRTKYKFFYQIILKNCDQLAINGNIHEAVAEFSVVLGVHSGREVEVVEACEKLF